MKIMIFVDQENFRQSLWKINKNRQEKTSALSNFLMGNLSNKLAWHKYTPRLIRTYVYTGEYTDSLINKIKGHLSKVVRLDDFDEMEQINKTFNKSMRNKELQKKIFEGIENNSNFLEIRTKPLQYSQDKFDVFQKGVDVQIAVDMVSHAYINSYDVAILCSGDVDLIESIRLVKNLGKKVIVVSHPLTTASQVLKECDYFIDLSKLNNEELDKISHLNRITV